MTGQDKLIGHGSQSVTFSDARFAHSHHIHSSLQKGSALESLQLQLQSWAQMACLKGQKGLSCWQASLTQQPCGPPCDTLLSLMFGQLKQVRFMREVLFGCFQGELRTDGCHAIQIQLLEQGVQFALPIHLITHGPSWREGTDRRERGPGWVSRSAAPLSPLTGTPGHALRQRSAPCLLRAVT